MSEHQPPRRAGGSLIALGVIAGTIIGAVLRQPVAGFLVGLALGVGIAGWIAWADSRPR